MDRVDFWFEARFDLKPGLLEQAGPHTSKFDWLGEQRFFAMAEDIIINKEHLPPMIEDYL